MDTLIAEDLILLLLDDESGRFRDATFLDIAVGGALLAELAIDGAIEVVEPGRRFASAKIRPTGAGLPADPVLAESLATIAERERSAEALVDRLGKRRRDQLLERLRERGVLAERHDRRLGVLPRTRWPTTDGTHEAGVRRAMAAALLQGEDPDQRTAVLIALLSSMGVAHKVIFHEGHSTRDVRRRAKEIAEGDWAAKAVKDAIAAVIAASLAAVTAAVTASGVT